MGPGAGGAGAAGCQGSLCTWILPPQDSAWVGEWQNACLVSAQGCCTKHLHIRPSEILAGKFCQVADSQQAVTGAGQLEVR